MIGNENAEWRRPTDGCDLFFDQAVIPIGAPNTPAAYAFLNFAYTPANAAKITDYVQYVTPVNGVKPILEKDDPGGRQRSEDLSDRAGDRAMLSGDPLPPGSPEDVADVEAAFQEVISG